MHRPLKMLDLFSGIGGFSLAAHWTGMIETVAFCEIEPFAQKVLRKNFPGVPIFEDVRTLKGGEIEPVDIICGGYPCQPFSLAGKRAGEQDDRHLWPEVHRLLQELRPAWVICENVAGHISMGLDQVLSDLEGIGYAGQAFVVPACAKDAPHRRDRVWIVANASSQGPQGSQQLGTLATGPWAPRPASQPGENGGTRVLANTNGNHRFGGGGPVQVGRKWSAGEVAADGYTGRTQWPVEPPVGRVAYGIPRRVDRLRGLGNAIVPQVAYEFFLAMLAAHRECLAS